jgi:hypothetical protein
MIVAAAGRFRMPAPYALGIDFAVKALEAAMTHHPHVHMIVPAPAPVL